MRRGILEAAEAMGGHVIAGGISASFEGAAIDSRVVAGGEMFFALEGGRTDGHRFVSSAIEAGASAAVVSRPVESTGCLVRVNDTFEALHDVVRWIRLDAPETIVGVTGSAGKTTTKELLAAMLAERVPTEASPGNLNNLYGFPLALLNLRDDTRWMVAEMGMSEPGELGRLSRLARPDVVLITNVRPAHLGAFGTLRAIARAKAEILEGLAGGGSAVLNADDEEVVGIGEECRSGHADVRILWYGLQAAVDSADRLVRVEGLETARGGVSGSRFDLVTADGRASVELRLPGRHNVENCLAAATAAVALGVDVGAVARAAAAVEPAPMRGAVSTLAGGARLWDDSYNSNPDAARRTLVAASEIRARRRWAVLGEMLELGVASEELHRDVGRAAAALGFDPVVGVGERARILCDAAADGGVTPHWFASTEDAVDFVRAELRDGDLVVVKGSRGVGLDRLVARLPESVPVDEREEA